VAGTSAGPGCSTVAANLAATLARTRSEVILVCADPGTTVAPQLLGIGPVPGLAELLAGTATIAEATSQPADVPRLRIITPGINTSGAPFDLQYDRSRRLLADLRESSRYVIIEAQSVGPDADSFQLVEFADSVIMTVETDLTSRMDATDCLNRLGRLRTTVLGAAVVATTRRARRAANQRSAIAARSPKQKSNPAVGPRPGDSARVADPSKAAGKLPTRPVVDVKPGQHQADETMPMPLVTARAPLTAPERHRS